MRMTFDRLPEDENFRGEVSDLEMINGELRSSDVKQENFEAIYDSTGRYAKATTRGEGVAVDYLQGSGLAAEVLDPLVKDGKLTDLGRDYLDDAVQAKLIWKKDTNYYLSASEVLLVDKNTGVTQTGQRLNRLHQAIEAKERLSQETVWKVSNLRRAIDGNLTLSKDAKARLNSKLSAWVGTREGDLLLSQLKSKDEALFTELMNASGEYIRVRGESRTTSSLTARDVLRLHGRVSGMTGTATQGNTAEVFKKLYGLDVLAVPRHNINRRRDFVEFFMTEDQRLDRLAKLAITAMKAQRSMLINVQTLEQGKNLEEKLLKRLEEMLGTDHALLQNKDLLVAVLNAENERDEDLVVARASQGGITIATNIAGRGTDIKIQESMTMSRRGGLMQINYGINDSRRVDDQSSGRAGRQFAQGESHTLLSMDPATKDYEFIKRGLFSAEILMDKKVAKMMQVLAPVTSLKDVTKADQKMMEKLMKNKKLLENIDTKDLRERFLEYGFRLAQRNLEEQNSKMLLESVQHNDLLFEAQLFVKPILDAYKGKLSKEKHTLYLGQAPPVIVAHLTEMFERNNIRDDSEWDLERLSSDLQETFGVQLTFRELSTRNAEQFKTALGRILAEQFAIGKVEERLGDALSDFFTSVQRLPEHLSKNESLKTPQQAEAAYKRGFVEALQAMSVKAEQVMSDPEVSRDALDAYVKNTVTSLADNRAKEAIEKAKNKEAENLAIKDKAKAKDRQTAIEKAGKISEVKATGRTPVAQRTISVAEAQKQAEDLKIQRTLKDPRLLQYSLARQSEVRSLAQPAVVTQSTINEILEGVQDNSLLSEAPIDVIRQAESLRVDGRQIALIRGVDDGMKYAALMPVEGSIKYIRLDQVSPEYRDVLETVADGMYRGMPVQITAEGAILIGNVQIAEGARVEAGALLIQSKVASRVTIRRGAFVSFSDIQAGKVGASAVVNFSEIAYADIGQRAWVEYVKASGQLTVGADSAVAYSEFSGNFEFNEMGKVHAYDFKDSPARNLSIIDIRATVYAAREVTTPRNRWEKYWLKLRWGREAEEKKDKTWNEAGKPLNDFAHQLELRQFGQVPEKPEGAVSGQIEQQLTVEEVLSHAKAMQIMTDNALKARDLLGKKPLMGGLTKRQRTIIAATLALRRLPTEDELKYFEDSEILVERAKDMPEIWKRIKDQRLPNVPFVYVKLSEAAIQYIRGRKIQTESFKAVHTSPYDAAIMKSLVLAGDGKNAIFNEVAGAIDPFVAAGSIEVNAEKAKTEKKEFYEDIRHEYGHHIDAGKTRVESMAGSDVQAPFVTRSSEDVVLLEEVAEYRLQKADKHGEFPIYSDVRSTVLTYALEPDAKTHHARTPEFRAKMNVVMDVIERLDKLFPSRVVTHMIRRARSLDEIIGWAKNASGGTMSDEELFDRHLPHFTKAEVERAKKSGFDAGKIALMDMDDEARERGYIRGDLADPTSAKVQEWANIWAKEKVGYLWREGGKAELQLLVRWFGNQDAILQTAVRDALTGMNVSEAALRQKVSSFGITMVLADALTVSSGAVPLAPAESLARAEVKLADVFTGAQDLLLTVAPAKYRNPLNPVTYRWALPEDAGVMGSNVAYFDETKNEIVLNPAKIADLPRSEAREDLMVAMVHELVHTAGGDEVAAYAATAEAMKKLDAARYASKIDILEALLALARGEVAISDAATRDQLQILANQLLIAKGDRAQILEILLNKVQSEVIAYKGAKLFGDIAGVKADASTASALTALARRTANPQHSAVLVLDTDLADAGLSAVLGDLVKRGFSVFVYNGKDVATYDVSKLFWTGQLAAWLSKDQFVKLMEVLPDAQTGRFSMQACLASQLVARLVTEIVAQQSVSRAA
ncbi:MAG: hypothetical protein PHV97_01025 [Candidatus Omnitrophica bacterium]|nr:hypothetical protein [Candidatus Omnitrophota bacterium]